MLSNRTIKFLTVATLIVAAVFVTTSMIDLPRPVVEQPMATSNAQGLAQYHQSERAGYTKEAGLTQYDRSERVLNVPQAVGLAIYHDLSPISTSPWPPTPIIWIQIGIG